METEYFWVISCGHSLDIVNISSDFGLFIRRYFIFKFSFFSSTFYNQIIEYWFSCGGKDLILEIEVTIRVEQNSIHTICDSTSVLDFTYHVLDNFHVDG